MIMAAYRAIELNQHKIYYGVSILSLLLTLHALTAVGVSVLFVVVFVGFHAAGSVDVSLLLVIILKHAGLFDFHLRIFSRLLASKRLLDLTKSGLGHGLGEGNLEDNIEVAEVVRLLVEGKTLVLDSLDLIGLDDLARDVLDSHL